MPNNYLQVGYWPVDFWSEYWPDSLDGMSISIVVNPTYRPKITFSAKRPYITFEILE